MQKLLTFLQQKNINVYAIFQTEILTPCWQTNLLGFEQLGPGRCTIFTLNICNLIPYNIYPKSSFLPVPMGEGGQFLDE